jgi:phosphoribulokinase
MAERGHSLDSIKKSIEARKPDFSAYIDPQKKDADVIIQVSITQHITNITNILLAPAMSCFLSNQTSLWLLPSYCISTLDPCSRSPLLFQVLPTQLVPDQEGKYLRVRLIQKEGKKLFDPCYLFDEGSTISWIPCGRKLTCSFPGKVADSHLVKCIVNQIHEEGL